MEEKESLSKRTRDERAARREKGEGGGGGIVC